MTSRRQDSHPRLLHTVCSDACETGWGVVSKVCNTEAIRNIGQHFERWRFNDPAAVAAREHAPEVATAIGPIKLRDQVWVKWVDGDGEFYGADVTNVSKTRGVTVR